MGRPPLPLGTMGEIRFYPAAAGKTKAVTKFRDFDGVTRQVGRVGRSTAQARDGLKEACRDRGLRDADADSTPATTVEARAEVWCSEIAIAVQRGELSPGTRTLYRGRLDDQVIKALGGLRLREVTVSRVDRMIKAVRQGHGVAI